jgi:23S rRNA pseudouridine1911/1915/1917 synthase
MASDLASRIIYGDASCVVVNKVAGEAVEGAGKGMADLPRLLAAELSAPYPPPLSAGDALPLPAAVHRLDVPVSGCAAFARTGAALRFLNAAFSGEAVKKHYWAIVEPSEYAFPPDAAGGIELVHWIQFDPRRNKSTAHNEPGPGRKKAVLRCCPAGRGERYLFLEIELITGRHHQIRAQFERVGLYIKGDLKYGARRSEPAGGIRLHARSLSFSNPGRDSADGDDFITVQADPPLRDNLWQAFMEASSS